MERFALAAAVVLGFALTAALCSLFVPLRRVLERREQQQQPVQSEQPRPAPLRAPLWGGLCAAAGTVAAVGVGWLAACVGQPELLGSDVPCDLSETVVTEYLRGELGYDGVVVTEDLDAIPNAYSANAPVQALLAGCDLIYTTNSVGDTLAALQQAVADGTLTEERVNESVYRILLLKCRFGIVTE